MYRGLSPHKPIGLETCRRAQVESLRAERFTPVPGVHKGIEQDAPYVAPLMPGVRRRKPKLAQACRMTYHSLRGSLMRIEIEREEDGRWIAEIPELPGVVVYGESRKQAIAKAEALALRVTADRLDNNEEIPELREVFAVSA
jgi:predicted RNase H-like HicB family nuclease